MSKPEVLIVEDDSKLRNQIQNYLLQKGFEVQNASDGWEGLEVLASHGCDVVILDVKLPGISGTDVLRKISTTYRFHPPVVIITGHGDKALAIEALRFGAFDFLEKPFHPQLLADTVERALKEKGQDIRSFRSQLVQVGSGQLTQRESEVAQLAASGLSNDQIAAQLSVGSETIKTHLKNIFKKLGVENRTTLSARIKG